MINKKLSLFREPCEHPNGCSGCSRSSKISKPRSMGLVDVTEITIAILGGTTGSTGKWHCCHWCPGFGACDCAYGGEGPCTANNEGICRTKGKNCWGY